MPRTHCCPGPRLMVLRPTLLSLATIVQGPGRVHSLVWQSAGFGLSMLRSHCRSWLPQRLVPARAGGLFLPSGSGFRPAEPEVLRQTRDSQNWVEAYAGNHHLPIEWAQKGVRKEDPMSRSIRIASGDSAGSGKTTKNLAISESCKSPMSFCAPQASSN